MPQPRGTGEDHFERRVRPLLVHACQKCHGATKTSGGLRLDSAAALARGGESGPVVVPGKPDASRLIAAVRHAADLKMPPGRKLKDSEIADLVDWVKAGAVWPRGSSTPTPRRDLWSLRPVGDPPLPAVKDTAWPRTPVDRFILARLEASGVKRSPPADRRTLVRRLYFDLVGLPPTPEEVEAFCNDNRPDAYERLVDRLLASPAYGERWGRHWLDVVRYAETTANDANAVMRYAWRYRDYVVANFNADLAYDEFLIEQLAGDLLPVADGDKVDVRTRRVIATGFLMVGPKALAETDKEQTRLDIVDEQLDVTSRAFLGLTVSCARCHDHKFDPIPTTDY
jgi:hypothetical protein